MIRNEQELASPLPPAESGHETLLPGLRTYRGAMAGGNASPQKIQPHLAGHAGPAEGR
jgi:hypothetical protein